MRFGLVAALVAALMCIVACGSSTPAPAAPSAQATARAAVSVSVDVWNMTAAGCISMAEAKEDDSIRQKCAAVLLPVHDSIEAAAAAVDAWSAAGASNFPCLMADVLNGLRQIQTLISDLGQAVPQVVLDAISLAQAIVPACVSSDAGAG